MVKKNSNKIIKLGAVVILVIGVYAMFIFLDGKFTIGAEKGNRIAFVSGTDNKMWYIKAKDCDDEVYENTDTKNFFNTMCRSYTTDGESVYYSGVHDISPTPILLPPVIIDGKVSSSSLPSSRRKIGPSVILGADPETFEVISSDYLDKSLSPKKSPTLTYARDKNFLYREGERVLGADPDTLLILGRGYIKDKNSVYYRGKKIKGSDGKTFEFLGYGYARDKNFVYLAWQGKKIEGSDGATFELLGDDGKYAKDSKNVYYNKEKIIGADPETFELMYKGNTSPMGAYIGLVEYAKDKNTVYYKGKKIEGSDPDTFELVGDSRIYAKDKNFVYLYYGAKKLPWINAETFKHVSGNYFKDNNAVYFNKGKILTSADPETFEVLGGVYAKDKNFVWRGYYLNEGGFIKSASIITGADPKTFEFLKYGYAKDKNFVYINGDVLLGADANSIEVLSHRYLKDKNFVYLGKEKLQNVDAQTFEVIDSNYTKDKDTVYFRGKMLAGVSPNSFKSFNCGYMKDQSKVFSLIGQRGEFSVIEGADALSFNMVGLPCPYTKDKNNVYYRDTSQTGNGRVVKINGANPETFSFLSGWYTKDLRGVYYKDTQIDGADTETFEAIDPTYAKDKNSAYYEGARIIGADSKTFEVMQRGAYSKDASFVYYKNVIIKGADPETFEVDRFGRIAKDKNTNYLNGKPITQKELLDKDAIIRPGFEKNESIDGTVMFPLMLEPVEIQEMYPAGL